MLLCRTQEKQYTLSPSRDIHSTIAPLAQVPHWFSFTAMEFQAAYGRRHFPSSPGSFKYSSLIFQGMAIVAMYVPGNCVK